MLPPEPPAKKKESPLGSNSSTEGPNGGEFDQQTPTGSEGTGVVAGSSGSEAAAGGPRGVAPPHVVVGTLGKPNGLDGHIGIYIEPEDLVYLEPGSVVLVDGTEHTVRSLRQGKKGPQVAFVDVTERSQAEAIRGSEVLVAQRRELGESEFWPSDLIGLEVRPGGGVVTAVNHGPAQDRLEIEREGVIFEVPFVDDFVPVVDIDAGYVEVVEIEGLIPPSTPG